MLGPSASGLLGWVSEQLPDKHRDLALLIKIPLGGQLTSTQNKQRMLSGVLRKGVANCSPSSSSKAAKSGHREVSMGLHIYPKIAPYYDNAFCVIAAV